MPLPDLLTELAALGCAVTVASGTPSVSPPRASDRARFADLLPLLKLHRAELVSHFAPPEECSLCGRVLDGEDRAAVVTNPLLCDRGGARECKDRKGRVIQQAVRRCPYKPREG